MSEPIEQAKELLSQAVNCWSNLAGAGEFQQAQFLLIEQKLLLLVEASDEALEEELEIAREEGFEEHKNELSPPGVVDKVISRLNEL